MDQQNFEFSVSGPEAELIGNALASSDLPHKQIVALLGKLQQQINAQLAARQAPKTGEAEVEGVKEIVAQG